MTQINPHPPLGCSLLLIGLLALLSLPLRAEETKEPAKVLSDQAIYVEAAQSGIKISGYVDGGYLYNFNGGGTTSLNRISPVDGNRRGNFNVNAFKLILSKDLPQTNDFAAGFRVDLVFGKDASFYDGRSNQALAGTPGNSDIGMAQACALFRAPVGNGLDFKVGKFIALLGYEASERCSNLNITYGNLQNFFPSNPTGVLASYNINDALSVQGAVFNGWNADTGTGVNGSSDQVAIAGVLTITNPGKNATLNAGFQFAPMGDGSVTFNNPTGTGALENEGYLDLDAWGTWSPQFAKDKLLLAFDTNYGSYNYQDDIMATPITRNTENWFGLALYSKYQFNDWFSLAGRGDWIKATDNQIFRTASPDFIGAELFSSTITASFDLWANMQFRTEYRADWGKDAITTNGDPSQGPAHTVATQIIYSF